MSEKIETPANPKAGTIHDALESRARKLGVVLGKSAFDKEYGKASPWEALTEETRTAYAMLCDAHAIVTGAMVAAHLKQVVLAAQHRYEAACTNADLWVKTTKVKVCPEGQQPAKPFTGSTEYQYAGALRRFLDSDDFAGTDSLPRAGETRGAWEKRTEDARPKAPSVNPEPAPQGADGARNDEARADRAADVAAVIRGPEGEMVKADSKLAKASALFAEKLAMFENDDDRAGALIAAANAVSEYFDMLFVEVVKKAAEA